jgi:AcrR family transcriptional regulator
VSTPPSRRRSPRRAPSADERGLAADRTRERILEAAIEEFGAKGYSGARTAGIAARAGVNQQLIAYYFGGKQGVLDELRRRWASAEAALRPADAGLGASLAAYLDATLDRPAWARLVIWQALGDGSADPEELVATQRARLAPALERMRHRQSEGEVTAAVDAEFLVLLTHLVTFAPIAMPHIVEAIFGVDPQSREYRERVVGQLLTLLKGDSHE